MPVISAFWRAGVVSEMPSIKNDSECNECVVARRRLPPVPEPMAFVQRDLGIVDWVYTAQLASREQMQQLFFTNGGRSRCQRRLTLLYRNRFIDKLPDRPVNTPDIYYISRQSVRGLRLLRSLHPEEPIKPRRVRAQRVEHVLAVAGARIALRKACAAAGYSLTQWLGEEDLLARLAQAGFLPDAYFQIQRPSGVGQKTANFFLEVERSGKAEQALEERVRRYGEFYYQGRYESAFEARALRVLFLVGGDYGINPQRQIEKLAAICQRLEVTFFRFASLEQFLDQQGSDLLLAPIWRRPEGGECCSLFGHSP